MRCPRSSISSAGISTKARPRRRGARRRRVSPGLRVSPGRSVPARERPDRPPSTHRDIRSFRQRETAWRNAPPRRPNGRRESEPRRHRRTRRKSGTSGRSGTIPAPNRGRLRNRPPVRPNVPESEPPRPGAPRGKDGRLRRPRRLRGWRSASCTCPRHSMARAGGPATRTTNVPPSMKRSLERSRDCARSPTRRGGSPGTSSGSR